MDIIIAFLICFILLIFTVINNIFVGFTLIICLIIFVVVAIRRGFNIGDILTMVYKGGKKSFIILQIFILIGAIVSTWLASGTVPSIVYYGIKLLNPHLFILSAFLISSAVSLLIGTSFGTIGTAGIALMVMAKGGGVSTSVTAGAILAGAYFGDRCSPMSSSANLVAFITGTDLYTNIKNMIKTSIIPLFISIILYSIVSFKYPLSSNTSTITSEIIKDFHIGFVALIPAFLILVLSFFKLNVKMSMLISIIVAAVIAVVVQKDTIMDIMKYLITGYKMDRNSYLKDIITGGGIISMVKVSFIVFISSALTGIFEGTSMLQSMEVLTRKARNRVELFAVNILVSIGTAAFGCTQVLTVILSHMLIKKAYEEKGISKEELAMDLENTAIVISPLIPWNIAVMVPLTTLNAGFDSIIYCFYLFLLPITNLVFLSIRYINKK